MKKFSEFTNQEKICFLDEVLNWYLTTHQSDVALGLCHAVSVAAFYRGIHVDDVQEFMGVDIWNPSFAESKNKSQYSFWWPTDDVVSRVMFINKLKQLYYV